MFKRLVNKSLPTYKQLYLNCKHTLRHACARTLAHAYAHSHAHAHTHTHTQGAIGRDRTHTQIMLMKSIPAAVSSDPASSMALSSMCNFSSQGPLSTAPALLPSFPLTLFFRFFRPWKKKERPDNDPGHSALSELRPSRS